MALCDKTSDHLSLSRQQPTPWEPKEGDGLLFNFAFGADAVRVRSQDLGSSREGESTG